MRVHELFVVTKGSEVEAVFASERDALSTVRADNGRTVSRFIEVHRTFVRDSGWPRVRTSSAFERKVRQIAESIWPDLHAIDGREFGLREKLGRLLESE